MFGIFSFKTFIINKISWVPLVEIKLLYFWLINSYSCWRFIVKFDKKTTLSSSVFITVCRGAGLGPEFREGAGDDSSGGLIVGSGGRGPSPSYFARKMTINPPPSPYTLKVFFININ